MSNEAKGGAFFAAPTFRQRFWRAMGFRYHCGEDPAGIDLLAGWMRTDMGLNFGLGDRLRILLSGRLRISSIVHFDTPSPAICKSRMDWQIVPLGKRGF